MFMLKKSLTRKIYKYTDKITVNALKETESTNKLAKQAALGGAKEGYTVIAERQTGGRGRLGRSFYSPDGGVYFSVVLRPDISPQETTFITVAAAVAVARAIEEVSGKQCLIKWVNDIYIDGKKVCGILTEGALSKSGEKLQYAVLGVGINLFEPKKGFPKDLPIADSIFNKKVKKCGIVQKNKLKAQIIAKSVNFFFEFYNKPHKSDYIKEYQRKSLLTGKRVTYTQNGETLIGEVLGIDDRARLIVKNGDKTTALYSGDVSITNVEGVF